MVRNDIRKPPANMWIFTLVQSIPLSYPIPLGASLLGYTKRVINETPTIEDITFNSTGNYKWFNGQAYHNDIPPSKYRMVNGVLSLEAGDSKSPIGGDLVSIAKDFTSGSLPLLDGQYGFYVEYEISLSNSNQNNFPAVWLMPMERNNIPGRAGVDDYYPDLYPSDPVGYERYMELDIDEGYIKYYTGLRMVGTVHDWKGICTYPGSGTLIDNSNIGANFSPADIDRTSRHIFGASYNPIERNVVWYLDGQFSHKANSTFVPLVAQRQHFYLIVSNQQHGQYIPYSMYFHGVRAFVPQSSPLPEV